MKGVVAAGHEVTARACADMLEAGGNAFDAALAGMVASGVPEIILSSLGGGGFMMTYRADTGETVLYDFFAQTPHRKRPVDELDFHAIHADFGPATQEFHIGAGSTATPGVIPGLFALHRDLCSLPLTTLFAPAISAARDGVAISPFQAYLFTVIEPILRQTPATRSLFAPRGPLLRAGELFRNPAFATLLETLAREGEDCFRTGDLAQMILAQSAEQGGHLQACDLLDYRVRRRQPLQQIYRDHRFFLNPAPCAGGPMIGFALGVLEQICKTHPPGLPDLITAMDLTNQARAQKKSALADFASQDHIRHHLEQMNTHPPAHRGTTHLSVLDASGNAAALTLSNGEGNGLMLGESGIMLNNMLGEEDLHDHGFHGWPENRRLSSMMSPTLIRSPAGDLTALGSGGSNRIRSAILQVAIGLIDHHLPLDQAISAPRLHVEKSGKISFEDQPSTAPFTPVAKHELQQRHPDAEVWPEANMFFGGVHGVQGRVDGKMTGCGDPRRDGASLSIPS